MAGRQNKIKCLDSRLNYCIWQILICNIFDLSLGNTPDCLTSKGTTFSGICNINNDGILTIFTKNLEIRTCFTLFLVYFSKRSSVLYCLKRFKCQNLSNPIHILAIKWTSFDSFPNQTEYMLILYR